jgi:hypothetical protein
MTESAKWPWYAFIYRFGGPHLTFWLWILALTGTWLFFKDALITVLNSEPHKRSVADVSSGQIPWHTWISIHGMEIKDARSLLGVTGKSGVKLRILLDPSDPAAVRWKQLHQLAIALGPKPNPDSKEARDFELMALSFAKKRDKFLPWRGLMLHDHVSIARIHSQTNLSKPLTNKERSPKMDFLAIDAAKFERRVQLVQENIIPRVDYMGVIDATPQIQVNRIHKELGVTVSKMTLRVNQAPRKRALVIFGICLFILLFLVAGLQGVFRHDDDLQKIVENSEATPQKP